MGDSYPIIKTSGKTGSTSIGSGPNLPADNSEYDLFETPAGLHYWSPLDGAWLLANESDTDTYLHTQSTPSATWTVTHNLGYRPPGVHIEDAAGNDMNGNVTHVSDNQLQISFAVAVDGTARVG